MLKTIIEQKKIELEALKSRIPIRDLEIEAGKSDFEGPLFSGALRQPGPQVIAEIKYKSPSHGRFKCREKPETIAASYADGGAAAVSVLTDECFFEGKLEYLKRIRKYLDNRDPGEALPLLRKDFIIDRYQVLEARINHASALLLIAAALSRRELAELLDFSRENGLEALVEIHDPSELEMVLECGAGIIGVNNRNLKTFKVDIKTSFDIARRLEGESGFLLVAESGITEAVQINELSDAGFEAFLVGSAFMDTGNPGEALGCLLSGIKAK